MFSSFYFVLGISCISLVVGEICYENDSECMTKIALKVGSAKTLINSEPLFKEKVIGDLPTIKYEFHNVTWMGFEDCKAIKLELCTGASTFDYQIKCPKLTIDIKRFTMKGHLGSFYIDSEGSGQVYGYDFVFDLTGHYTKAVGKDKVEHYKISDYDIDVINRRLTEFNFKTFPIEKDEEVQNFFKTNWEISDKTLRGPPVKDFLDLYIDKVNYYLSIVPVNVILSFN